MTHVVSMILLIATVIQMGRLTPALGPIVFMVGVFLSLWWHADGMITSKLRPDVQTYRDFWMVLRPVICIRIFAALCGYGLGTFAPEWTMAWYQKVCVAGLMGLGVDLALKQLAQKVPFLQGAIPDFVSRTPSQATSPSASAAAGAGGASASPGPGQ